jgi:hypothetical protein
MFNYKPFATPIVPNLLLNFVEDVDLVDPTLFMQLIGSLMYLVNTRPDICYATNTLTRFLVEPRQSHWKYGKHVLGYLKGTIHYGMKSSRDGKLLLHTFVDSDWTRDVGTGKNIFGYCYCFNLGSSMIS